MFRITKDPKVYKVLVIGDSTSADYPNYLSEELNKLNIKFDILNKTTPIACRENFEINKQTCNKTNFEFYDQIIKSYVPDIVLIMTGERLKSTTHAKVKDYFIDDHFLMNFYLGNIFIEHIAPLINTFTEYISSALYAISSKNDDNNNKKIKAIQLTLDNYLHGEFILGKEQLKDMQRDLGAFSSEKDIELSLLLNILLSDKRDFSSLEVKINKANLSENQKIHLLFHLYRHHFENERAFNVIKSISAYNINSIIDYNRSLGEKDSNLQIQNLISKTIQNPNSMIALELARTLALIGQNDKALEVYEHIIKQKINFPFVHSKAYFMLIMLKPNLDAKTKHDYFQKSLTLSQVDGFIFDRYLEFLLSHRIEILNGIQFLTKLKNQGIRKDHINTILEILTLEDISKLSDESIKKNFIIAMNSKDYQNATKHFLKIPEDKTAFPLDMDFINSFARKLITFKDMNSQVFFLQVPNQKNTKLKYIFRRKNFLYIDTYECFKNSIQNNRYKIQDLFHDDGIHLKLNGSKEIAKCVALNFQKYI